MNIEHAHEDADAGKFGIAETEFLGSLNFGNHLNGTVCRRNDEVRLIRGNAFGIAEEIETPDGQYQTDPAQRLPNHCQ